MTDRGGRTPKHLALEVLGWLLLVAGIAMIALPGPGLLGMFAGLALLSQRYEWAERRVEPVRLRAMEGAAQGVQTWPRILGSLFGVAALVGLAVYWFSAPPAPSWWPDPDPGSPLESFWAYIVSSAWNADGLVGGMWTALVQVISAAIALALLVYSYRRFHGHPEALAELRGEIDDADDAADGHAGADPRVGGGA